MHIPFLEIVTSYLPHVRYKFSFLLIIHITIIFPLPPKQLVKLTRKRQVYSIYYLHYIYAGVVAKVSTAKVSQTLCQPLFLGHCKQTGQVEL